MKKINSLTPIMGICFTCNLNKPSIFDIKFVPVYKTKLKNKLCKRHYELTYNFVKGEKRGRKPLSYY